VSSSRIFTNPSPNVELHAVYVTFSKKIYLRLRRVKVDERVSPSSAGQTCYQVPLAIAVKLEPVYIESLPQRCVMISCTLSWSEIIDHLLGKLSKQVN
jgi:hypothetical protein